MEISKLKQLRGCTKLESEKAQRSPLVDFSELIDKTMLSKLTRCFELSDKAKQNLIGISNVGNMFETLYANLQKMRGESIDIESWTPRKMPIAPINYTQQERLSPVQRFIVELNEKLEKKNNQSIEDNLCFICTTTTPDGELLYLEDVKQDGEFFVQLTGISSFTNERVTFFSTIADVKISFQFIDNESDNTEPEIIELIN